MHTIKHTLSTIMQSLREWRNRPRIYCGLFSKHITLYANNQIATIGRHGVYIEAKENIVSITYESGLAVNVGRDNNDPKTSVSITMKDVDEANKFVYLVYKSIKPRWLQVAKNIAYIGVFALFVTVFAEQPAAQAPEVSYGVQPPVNPITSPDEMGLPPMPFSE